MQGEGYAGMAHGESGCLVNDGHAWERGKDTCWGQDASQPGGAAKRERAIHSTAAGEMVDVLRVHGRVDEREAQGMGGEEGAWG